MEENWSVVVLANNQIRVVTSAEGVGIELRMSPNSARAFAEALNQNADMAEALAGKR